MTSCTRSTASRWRRRSSWITCAGCWRRPEAAVKRNKVSRASVRKLMHDTPDQVHWHEPKAGENAGLGKFKRAPMPYDRFMEAEGVPVYRGIGVRRGQELPLGPWPRLRGGGRHIPAFWPQEGLGGFLGGGPPARAPQ